LSVGNIISGRLGAALLATLLLAVPSLAATTHKAKHKKTSASKSASAKKASAKRASGKTASGKSNSKGHLKRTRHTRNWKRHGQQTVDGRRTEQIQQALIQSHYLDGEPSGAWDAKTQEALRRYQAANGWQSKVVPDSRALIKLGLGPSTDKLLNPESAMTSHVEKTPPVVPEATSGPNTPR
jgi:peptidoglycan hydrolase-like protein with peptidoglycan-binding domain